MTYEETKNELKKRGLLNILKCLEENDNENKAERIDSFCLHVSNSLETRVNAENVKFLINSDYIDSFDGDGGYTSIIVYVDFLSNMTAGELEKLNKLSESIYCDCPIDDCDFAIEKDRMITNIMKNHGIDTDNIAVYDYLNCDCEYDSQNIYYDSDRLMK